MFGRKPGPAAAAEFLTVGDRKYAPRDVHILNVELDDVRGRRRDVTRQLLQLLELHVLPGLDLTPQTGELVANLLGTNAIEAAYLLKGLQDSLKVEGDICEFGVAQGRTSALLAHHILPTERQLWLYDSFEGLPAPDEKDLLIDDIFRLGTMDAYRGTMSNPDSLVREQLSRVGFPAGRTQIVKGWVEDTIGKGIGPAKVAFAYLDCDLYSPTITILRALHGRTFVGSVLVLDDYAYFSSGVETAASEFLSSHPGQYALEAPFDVDIAGAFRTLRRIA